MRLIGGFLHLDGRSAEAARLEAMAAAMAATGLQPRIARHVEGPIAMLSLDFTPGPAGEVSPTRRGDLIVAADLRLDEPKEVGDDSGLATLLADQGIPGLGRLSGDFAFAAWDGRSRTLLCARDGFGIRPFFFLHRPKELFVFASLPRGLHASGLLARSIDHHYLVNELLFRFDGPERSLFKGVERLPPGGWLQLGADGAVRSGRHWALDPALAGSRRIGAVEAAVELKWLVGEAVRRRLPLAGPVAAHLSGGLDSSAIAILSARNLRSEGRRVLAYSQVPAPFGSHTFGGHGPYIAPVLQQEPDIVWQPIRNDDPAAFVLPEMDPDQLVPIDPSHRESRIFADAGAQGAQTLLSGWGGDECVSYSWRGVLAEALLSGHWAYLFAELRALGSARAAWAALSPFLVPAGARTAARRVAGHPPSPAALPDLAAGLLRAQHVPRHSLVPRGLPPDARRIRALLLGSHGLTRRAEQWALMAARHGMSVGFPMLDRRLVEFALSLPSRLFVRDSWSRRVFRDAMVGVLPDELCWKRTKADLTVEDPIHVATQRPRLAGRLTALRGRDVITDLFDLDAVEARLAGLPPADVLAHAIGTGEGDQAAVEKAGSLMRAFRVMAYLEQHG